MMTNNNDSKSDIQKSTGAVSEEPPSAPTSYISWLLDHPSSLDMFDEIINQSKGKQIVMFLDYDGTLSPIVQDPDKAFMSQAMRKTVKKLATCFPTAIVSGRCRDKVYGFIRLPELYYAGSHGLDIKGPTKSSQLKNAVNQGLLYQPAIRFLSTIDKVYGELVEKMRPIQGSKVENNKFCISVHFRRVDEKQWNNLVEEVKSVVENTPELKQTEGKKVLEIRPDIKWDKGKELEFLLKSLGYAKSSNVFPIYIGDDTLRMKIHLRFGKKARLRNCCV